MFDVPRIILEQLGGNKFIAMTGAKKFDGTIYSLNFKIGKNKTSANSVEITLKGDDLYMVQFRRISITKKGVDVKEIHTAHGVYADQLQPLFTEITGMHTSLGTMRG